MATRTSLSRRLRNLARRLYNRRAQASQRRELERLWNRTRRGAADPLFPALREYALSTPEYLHRTGTRASGKRATVIPIPDETYFDPPPPKTVGYDPLVHQLVRLNPPLFAARVQEAGVFGDAGDIVTHDNTLLPDIGFRRPLLMLSERGEHPLLEQDPLPDAQKLSGTYALLTSLYSGSNYFHWLFNALPRLALLERAGVRFDQLDGFLLNQIAMPAIPEMLGVLGIPPASIVQMDRRAALHPDTVWVTASLISNGHHRRPVCDWLRHYFLPPVSVKPARRIFISRADAAERRMVNENQLFEILAPLGFETICLSNCSVREQAELFACAEIVIAPHGAGLANLVFCSPGTRVLEFMRADRLRTMYWELSACLGLDYYYGLSQPDPHPSPERVNREDTFLSPDALRALLKKANIN